MMTAVIREDLDFLSLPDDPIARREVLEDRATPNTTKPRLSPDMEAELAELEERSAQCYIQAEDHTYRLFRVAKRINEGTVPRDQTLLREVVK